VLPEQLSTLIIEKDKLIQELKLRVICDHKLQNKLQAKGKAHISKWADLAKDSGYNVNKRRAISWMWGDYKKHFDGLQSYRNTPEFRFEEALHWIDAWTLPNQLLEPLSVSKGA